MSAKKPNEETSKPRLAIGVAAGGQSGVNYKQLRDDIDGICRAHAGVWTQDQTKKILATARLALTSKRPLGDTFASMPRNGADLRLPTEDKTIIIDGPTDKVTPDFDLRNYEMLSSMTYEELQRVIEFLDEDYNPEMKLN